MAAKTRQIVLVKILRTEDDDESSGSMLNAVPLGSYKQVVQAMSYFNTAPDGSNDPESFGLLHGPGLIMQLPMVGPDDQVMQLGVSMHEEELAWPVLMRICRRLGWKMMDPGSGRTFGG